MQPTNLLRQAAEQAQAHLSQASQAAEQARRQVRELDTAVKQAAQQSGISITRRRPPSAVGGAVRRPSIRERTDLRHSTREARQMVLIACWNRLKSARRAATFRMARANRGKLAAYEEAARAYEAYRGGEESDGQDSDGEEVGSAELDDLVVGVTRGLVV
ncbi:hypothetical protein LTR53_009850 [Teratosphaeriaceae sp. CCFEE 6253]|nr:hypothetical protein LTR53_009850 [Teratosphaeriaceae sp. CCFEE 6253]